MEIDVTSLCANPNVLTITRPRMNHLHHLQISSIWFVICMVLLFHSIVADYSYSCREVYKIKERKSCFESGDAVTFLFGDYYCCSNVTDADLISFGASAFWIKDRGFCGRGACENCIEDTEDCIVFGSEDVFCCPKGYQTDEELLVARRVKEEEEERIKNQEEIKDQSKEGVRDQERDEEGDDERRTEPLSERFKSDEKESEIESKKSQDNDDNKTLRVFISKVTSTTNAPSTTTPSPITTPFITTSTTTTTDSTTTSTTTTTTTHSPISEPNELDFQYPTSPESEEQEDDLDDELLLEEEYHRHHHQTKKSR